MKLRFLLIPISLVFVAYGSAIHFGFVFDDIEHFNFDFPRLTHWYTAFWYFERLNYTSYYRPIVLFLWRLLFGVTDSPPIWHFVSLLLHAANVLLFYFVSREIFKPHRQAGVMAWMACLIFAVYPPHTEVIVWIAAQIESMAAIFFMGLFLTWNQFLKTRRLYWIAYSLVLFLLAIGTKEISFFLFLTLPIYELLWYPPKKNWIKRISLYFLFIIPAIPYLILRYYHTHSGIPFIVKKSIPQILANGIGAFGFYIQKSIWFFDRFPYSTHIPTSGPFLILSVFSMLFLILTLFSYRRNRIIFFSLLFFLITLSPATILVMSGVSTVPLGERYLYFPSMGLCWVLGYVLGDLKKGNHSLWMNRIKWGVLAALTGIMIWNSASTSKYWHDEGVFWKYAVRTSPDSPFPYFHLGSYEDSEKNWETAISLYEKGISLCPPELAYYRARGHIVLGTTYARIGNIEKSRENLLRSIAIAPVAPAYYNLAMTYVTGDYGPGESKESLEKAIEYLLQAVKIDSYYAKAYYQLGRCYESLADTGHATKYYQRALAVTTDPQLRAEIQSRLSKLGAS